ERASARSFLCAPSMGARMPRRVPDPPRERSAKAESEPNRERSLSQCADEEGERVRARKLLPRTRRFSAAIRDPCSDQLSGMRLQTERWWAPDLRFASSGEAESA